MQRSGGRVQKEDVLLGLQSATEERATPLADVLRVACAVDVLDEDKVMVERVEDIESDYRFT